jgi:hypothetical protein
MSGRLQASGAGDRSSVLVSPGTLKTVTVIFFRLRAAGEPLGIGPALHHFLGLGIAGLGLGGHVVEEVEHQQRLLQRLGGHAGHFGVVQQLDQGCTL